MKEVIHVIFPTGKSKYALRRMSMIMQEKISLYNDFRGEAIPHPDFRRHCVLHPTSRPHLLNSKE